jgi:copper chaperone NosL
MMSTRLAAVSATLLLAAGCTGSGAAGPVAIELGRDACSHCRMAIVSTGTAAEIVAAGEEPRLFDDLGCLRHFIAAASLPADAVVFVADHRTGVWVEARRAVFTSTSLETPMGSGLVAHADAASRDQDPTARGEPVSMRSILP